MSVHSLFSWKSKSIYSLNVLTGCSLLCALYTVLRFFTIPLSATLFVSFSFLALALSCRLYGIWPNMIFAFAADFLGYVVNPKGAYNPLLAVVLMVKALIYCLFFYGQKKVSVPRILLAQFLASLICNVLLNPLILSWMYQMPWWSLVVSRVAKNLILYPIECLLLYLVFKLSDKIEARKGHSHA